MRVTWDYRNPYEWMDLVAKSELPPMMIQCCITGSIQGKEYNPNIPETIEEQIEAVEAAYEAGATEVHIHVRNPENITSGTKNPEHFSRINAMVRDRCPGMIVNNSCGGGPDLTIREKMAAIFAECKPDVVSLNPGPFMMNMHLKERKPPLPQPRPDWKGDVIIPVRWKDVYDTAEICLEKGIKPAAEVFHPGQFEVLNELIAKGLLKAPYLMQFVFGFQTSVQPNPWSALAMLDEAPEDSIVFYPGIGPYELPMNTLGTILGGHVRIGLEDNVYYSKGKLADSTAQLVERAVRIAKELNRPIATCEQALEMCGLAPVK